MKVSYNWLKDYLGESLPSAEEVADLLTEHSFEIDGVDAVEDDVVIDIDVLPNRSSDSLCHRGIARELATILNIDLEKDPLREPYTLKQTNNISVKIEAEEDCPRFMASVVTGVNVASSPEWLKKRLEVIGVRSVNNIVDATNYVMFAIGEPIHAYDADLFPQKDGVWQFVIRKAVEGEEVSLLAEGGKGKVNTEGGEEDRIVVCKGTELLIVDGSSNTPIGLAGVKGGRFAGITADTKNIVIEAAHFNPTTTRKTARGLGIVIDASKRFENEPSRDLPPYAQRDVIQLISEIAGGTYEGSVDVYLEKKENPTVPVTVAKTNSLLGLQLTAEEIAEIIRRTGSTVTIEGDVCMATGPWERTDLTIEADFIEEVARIHGLSQVVSIAPEVEQVPEINVRQYYSDKIRDILTDLGFSEVITSSFHKKGKIQLQNALASDKSYVRGNLRKNIEETLDKNYANCDLLGIPDVRVFEIGTVFLSGEKGVEEHVSLAIGARTKGNGYSNADDKILNSAVESVKRVLNKETGWQIEKGIAEMNLSEALPDHVMPAETAYFKVVPGEVKFTYKPYSAYPAMSRDIALWVSEGEEADAVLQKLTEQTGSLLVRHTLFDTFTKDGRTSYAFRFVFQSNERTLTDGEINSIMHAVYEVAKANGWEVR